MQICIMNILNISASKKRQSQTHAYPGFSHDFAGFIVQVAVEHAIGELMFNINLLSFSVTDEEVGLFFPEMGLGGDKMTLEFSYCGWLIDGLFTLFRGFLWISTILLVVQDFFHLQ